MREMTSRHVNKGSKQGRARQPVLSMRLRNRKTVTGQQVDHIIGRAPVQSHGFIGLRTVTKYGSLPIQDPAFLTDSNGQTSQSGIP